MKHYLICPEALIGYIYFEDQAAPTLTNMYPEGKVGIVFEANYGIVPMLQHSYYIVVTKATKQMMESSHLNGFSFRAIYKIIREYLNDENGPLPNAEAYTDDFWLLIGADSTSQADFIQWGPNLIVSERALQFLYDNNLFKDDIQGKPYGLNFEVLTNKFLIEGNIENFILEKMPLHRKHISKMRQKMRDERRRQKGLPPLNN